ncbi:MAG TPA: hypothetical protein VII85_09615, partial [Candidatus Krumholzibacteriaceae bacterium]
RENRETILDATRVCGASPAEFPTAGLLLPGFIDIGAPFVLVCRLRRTMVVIQEKKEESA